MSLSTGEPASHEDSYDDEPRAHASLGAHALVEQHNAQDGCPQRLRAQQDLRLRGIHLRLAAGLHDVRHSAGDDGGVQEDCPGKPTGVAWPQRNYASPGRDDAHAVTNGPE